MQRIKTMLLAMVAVFAIGAVGASAAGAAGTATVTLVGAGSCDVAFDSTAWYSSGIGWASDIDNIDVDTGGTCDVDNVTGEGVLYKQAPKYATFEGEFALSALNGEIECFYEGVLTGKWKYIYDGDPPEIVGKKFKLSGFPERQEGSHELCPEEPEVEMKAWVDA